MSASAVGTGEHPGLSRLADVMAALRRGCPWDAEQTHRSLVQYLIEETAELVEAIETGDHDHLAEELGDVLFQVYFHAEIAAETGEGFDLDDVAAGVADKLTRRHPHVFRGEGTPVPDSSKGGRPPLNPVPAPRMDLTDLNRTWEQRKAEEKGRTSVLEGIPEQLSALARAGKIISRARSRQVPVELPDDPIDADDLGRQIVALVARGHAGGIDPDQAVRDAIRELERDVRAAENGGA